MKKCISCGEIKNIDEFYRHPRMGDGHLNKCKDCCRNYSRAKYFENMNDPVFVKKERKRNNLRYYRKRNIGKPVRQRLPKIHNCTWKDYFEKYPEKYKAQIASQRIKPVIAGDELHHWSYSESNSRYLIELLRKDHVLAHTKLIYNQEYMCFTSLDGVILDTIEKHVDYLKSIGIEIVKIIDKRHVRKST